MRYQIKTKAYVTPTQPNQSNVSLFLLLFSFEHFPAKEVWYCLLQATSTSADFGPGSVFANPPLKRGKITFLQRNVT